MNWIFVENKVVSGHFSSASLKRHWLRRQKLLKTVPPKHRCCIINEHHRLSCSLILLFANQLRFRTTLRPGRMLIGIKLISFRATESSMESAPPGESSAQVGRRPSDARIAQLTADPVNCWPKVVQQSSMRPARLNPSKARLLALLTWPGTSSEVEAP